jgi:hypothetical protein
MFVTHREDTECHYVCHITMYLSKEKLCVLNLSGREHTKETGNRNATAISEKCRRFPARNWLPA